MHLSPTTEDVRDFLDILILQLACLVVDQIGVLKLIILFVELSEANPDFGGLTGAFLRIDSLNCLSKGLDCQVGVLLAELDSVEPLVDIVRVLAEHHITQQEWPSLNEILEENELEFVLLLLGELLELRLDVFFPLLLGLVSESKVQEHVDLIS